MAEEIRIDDLSAPLLNDMQRMGIEYGESTPTELSVDAVCAAAAARTGLSDFGPYDFRERLGVQLAEMDADEERTGLGRLLMFSDCTRYAANRLLIYDLLTRHPEILEIPIIRPVIVVGLPRSGTTHLVNLLAADTRFRSMPLWESYEPVPNPKEPSEVDGVDPRWTRCEGTWQAMQTAAPFVAAMHPMEPDHVHEEIELQTARLLELHPRVGGAGSPVARLLPGTRPDAALRVHEDRPSDHAVVPPTGALGTQIAAASRTGAATPRHLP